MTVLINFKICDNSKDCNGITVCPTKTIYWDEKNKTIKIDNSKCICCGKCEESCPVEAIKVAKNDKEYDKIKKDIEKDPRKVSDLFVDRYGAEPISLAFLIDKDKFNIQILESTKIAAVEFFSKNSIKCLLHSIPIKSLFEGVDVKYRKINVGDGDPLLKNYDVKELPVLLFFKDGKLIGKIEGYYKNDKEKELKKKVDSIIK